MRFWSFLILVCAFAPVRAVAVPMLQLDASPGTYIGGTTEGTVTTSNTFTLYALLNSLTPAGPYYISAALAPAPSKAGADLGSFIFNGQTVRATGDMTWGSPAMLQPHGVYPTWYKEFAFNFSPAQTTVNYDVADVQNQHNGPVLTTPGDALYQGFSVDVTGLATGSTLVFDLYTYSTTATTIGSAKKPKVVYKTTFDFAPFSHNAESASHSVPDEGSTFALVGLALIAGEGFRRFLRAQK